MSAHHPGPWTISAPLTIDGDEMERPPALCVFDGAGRYFADVHRLVIDDSDAPMREAAALIAAAPELLAALKAVANEYGGTRSVAPDDPRAAAVRAAIAKAEAAQ